MNKDAEDFETWWYREGSGIFPLPNEEAENHVHRVSKIAWLNGADKAREAKEDA